MENEWRELKLSIQAKINRANSVNAIDIMSTAIVMIRQDILREMEKLETKKSLIEAGY